MLKKLVFFPVILLFISCASVHLPVPGETEVYKENIYSEYMLIADAYLDQAKYEKSISYYKKAMKSRKLYWSAYYKMGRAYALDKNWAEAQKVFANLYKRDMNNVSVQMSLAYIYAMNGKLASAENIYAYLWGNNSENADILVNYINVLLAEEKFDEAKNLYAELKEKFHENSNLSSFEKKFEEVENSEKDETEENR